MKALPLWQPYASLVAAGAKRVETRAYPPRRLGLRDGQRIAIHACKTDKAIRLALREPFRTALRSVQGPKGPTDLPLGALLCTATILRSFCVTGSVIPMAISPVELAFGDYSAGRWGWMLGDVVQLPEPIPFTGSQGTFDVPDELLGHAPIDPAQGVLL